MRIKTYSDFRPNGPPPRLGLKAASPGVAGADEDCNSNTSLTGSQHSTQDEIDAHCDNSDYLWFLDYNPIFRDGSCHHTSVLSSVSASYKGISDLTSRFEFTSRYNDLARDLDANLAEADMESFRTEDIHALLMTANLPHDTIIDDRTHDWNPRGEMFASISSSLLARFRFDSSVSADSSFQVRLTLLFNVSFNSFMKASRIFISFYIYSTIYLILIAQHIILRPILI